MTNEKAFINQGISCFRGVSGKHPNLAVINLTKITAIMIELFNILGVKVKFWNRVQIVVLANIGQHHLSSFGSFSKI